jgi:hypothetical protein
MEPMNLAGYVRRVDPQAVAWRTVHWEGGELFDAMKLRSDSLQGAASSNSRAIR